MRIKEVCQRTGLTDRAIRLYMENGLVVPEQECNHMGRRSISFSEEDIRTLEAVATLRRTDFSIADIVQMQALPDSMVDIVACHRKKLAEEIATKQIILDSLEQYDAQTQKDYYGLASAIRRSASRNSMPKEDSGMNIKDINRIIRKRIPALIALMFLIFALFSIVPMVVRTAFAEISISSGGGYTFNYHWNVLAFKEHIVILLSVILLFLGVVSLVLYLAGGKRYWLMVSTILCAISVILLLFMPSGDSERIYLYEFLAYRNLFKGTMFYNNDTPSFLIKTLKYVPIAVSMVLSCVGYFTDTRFDQE